jgi:pyridoxal phosphate enzyme (YggS family)
LIGPLQTNKAKKIVPAFAAVHSIDRLKIARVLDKEAAKLEQTLTGFLEINLAAEESKHGFLPAALPGQLEELAGLEHLRIVGLMAIPPFEADPQASRAWFRQLRDLRDQICSLEGWSDCPGMLSMGMSHDYDVAIEEGATHVRIGTSLFGPRET